MCCSCTFPPHPADGFNSMLSCHLLLLWSKSTQSAEQQTECNPPFVLMVIWFAPPFEVKSGRKTELFRGASYLGLMGLQSMYAHLQSWKVMGFTYLISSFKCRDNLEEETAALYQQLFLCLVLWDELLN